MNSTRELHRTWTDRIFESHLAPYVDAFTHHLTERGYASHTVGNYLACIAHFARWTSRCRLDIHGIDEDVVRRFLDDHLPHCNCARPVQRTHHHLRAALGHLLVVLRTNSVIAEHLPGMTPVDKELRRFDDHMKDVRGLASKTRRMALHPVRLLLLNQFGERSVVFSAIKPDDVRRFIAACQVRYSTPASAGALASALRGYFRFRAICGDQVHGLIGVVSYPANWQLASLPKALSPAEVERLLGSLGHGGPSARRAAAIVRCALDLGLRSSEVAKLGLDDIDWRAGTVTLRRTKSRREDVLPLPEATGRAIADYLKFGTSEDDQPVGVRASRCTTRPTDWPRSRPQGDPPSLCPGRTAVHQGPPSAPHHGQPLAGGWEFAQGGGRCLATPLAEHDADLRQTRQQ